MARISLISCFFGLATLVVVIAARIPVDEDIIIFPDDFDIPIRGGQTSSQKPPENAVQPTGRKPIKFHKRCGMNMKVSEDGNTAYRRINFAFGHTAAVTDRTLDPDEIFEVWVDSLEYVENPRIGVTTYPAETIDYPDYMNHLKSGTWGWDVYPGNIYQDGQIIKEPYQTSRYEIQRGDRYGVQVTSKGDLHFHHNGRDLGPAAHGLTGKGYYAYIDMYWGGSNATIVN